MELKIYVPVLPPGINKTYQVSSVSGKAEMYKSSDATDWAAKAALFIGSKAAEMGWVDDSKYYEISMTFYNMRGDVDGPIKLCIDVVSQKLGFDDKRIKKQSSEKEKHSEAGVLIKLKPYVKGSNNES